MAEIRNREGYVDLTAYEAHKKIEIEERNKKNMAILKGDIYFIESFNTAGSEQRPARPAIIVSNNKCNEVSDVVEVVYLTTQPKKDLPTHVTIRSTSKTSTALCEQISSVSIDRLGNYLTTVTDEELMNLEIALMVSLGITTPKQKTVTKEVVKEVPVGGAELEEVKANLKNVLAELHASQESVESLKNSLADMTARHAKVSAKFDLMRELYAEAVAGPAKIEATCDMLAVSRGALNV